ncbi:MAG: phenylacetate--CoA ligase family protein [Candidatus Xenobium sp.]|jgi:phenylacetate-CoA ligase
MLRTLLTRRLYMPLASFLQGESIFSCLHELEQTQYWSSEELRSRQFADLRDTFRAASHIPFYRARGYPTDLQTWADFLALPILEKSEVRENFEGLRNPGPGESRGHTSGSTGEPLRFTHGPAFRSRHEAGQWRARGWFGVRPGEGILAVWGRPVGTPREWNLLRLKSFLNHLLHVSAFDLSPSFIRSLYPQIRRLRPRLVYGYPSGLEVLARQAEADGVRLDGLGVRLVACTAEVLYGFQRDLLARAFGAPVADVYGCGEFGSFAHQCPHGRMHVACENVLVEFLDDLAHPVPAGTPGQVVVTSLHNPGMPLIRYRVGDLAVPIEGGCPCGRNLPLMDVRTGKTGQMVRTAGGRMFSTELFDYVNKSLLTSGHRQIRTFHVVQTALEDFTVRYVTEAEEPGPALAACEKGLREVLGAQVRIVFEKVEEIPRHPGGKLGYFTCQMPPEA